MYLFAGIILFFQAVTGELPVRLDVSVASNQSEHPVICVGKKYG